MLLFQPQWAAELSGNHHTFASARRTQRTSYTSSSEEAQTTCYCSWNLRIKSSSKLSVWHFFGNICSAVKFSNINWKNLSEGPNWRVLIFYSIPPQVTYLAQRQWATSHQNLERWELQWETPHQPLQSRALAATSKSCSKYTARLSRWGREGKGRTKQRWHI